MKICAIICEYNPFHNGHAYHIQEAKRLSKADAILCIMSGNFVQRGEAAIFEKHLRAKHAVLAGADAVILGCTELSVAFSGACPAGVIDALEVLVCEAILLCGASLREEVSGLDLRRALAG